MALRKPLVKRLCSSKNYNYGYRLLSPAVTLEHSPLPHPLVAPSETVKTNFHSEYITSPESTEKGFFRKFLQRRAINQSASRFPEFLSLPVGEKLRNINLAGDRLRFEGLSPPVLESPTSTEKEKEKEKVRSPLNGLTVDDARKLLRLSQVEKLKLKLREIHKSSISYNEFVRICTDSCENEDQGVEFAKLLDESGNVIVLGNMVFLQPEKVARSMESIISETVATTTTTTPNDPRRRKELESMETEKAMIDQKAKAQVRGELYCGLGLLAVQTLGFMRLTFWELSWDVMEPICFFATSFYFALNYGFFLRTSTEPTFEGYFYRRFKAKQKKLMKAHNFDEEKYKQLCEIFYPPPPPPPEGGSYYGLPGLYHFKSLRYQEALSSRASLHGE